MILLVVRCDTARSVVRSQWTVGNTTSINSVVCRCILSMPPPSGSASLTVQSSLYTHVLGPCCGRRGLRILASRRRERPQYGMGQQGEVSFRRGGISLGHPLESAGDVLFCLFLQPTANAWNVSGVVAFFDPVTYYCSSMATKITITTCKI